MKILEKILCLSLSVLLCFSLIGCNQIDKMRKSQIHFNDNGNLIYNKNEYKLLPQCEDFSPQFTLSELLNITDTDVPVLLSEFLGDRAYLSDDAKYIQTNDNEYYTSHYYAREDFYDSIADRINNGNYFDGYCFYYSYYDENDEIPSYKEKNVMISKEAENAFNMIINSATPDDEVDIDLLYQYAVTDLYACSNDFLFKKYVGAIFQTNKSIYIAYYPVSNLEKELVFKVEEKYYDEINEIIESYRALTIEHNNHTFAK